MEKSPYEVLVRWDEQGNLIGAHVQWRYVFRDEHGNVIGDQVAPAEPLGIGGGSEVFPLASVMTQAEQDALTRANALTAENALLRQENERLHQGLARPSAD